MPAMKTRNLVAVRSHKYGTRHLVAGDEYEVPAKHAVALVAGRKARFAPERPRPPAAPPQRPPVSLPEPAASDMEKLRARARTLGIEVDGRWGVARLRDEITKAMAG